MAFYFLAIGFAMAMVILSKMPLAVAQHQSGGYDNRNPRQQQAGLTGWGRRALAAHQNTFESFPLFAAGMITGHLMGTPAQVLNLCAGIFLLARLLYIGLYLANWSTARSSVWALGFFASLYPIFHSFL